MLRALFLLALCLATPAMAAQPLQVVASFSIVADMAREVGGERVAVSALVGPDEDAHSFQPRPSDARRVRDAAVVLANGLGFDGWIGRLARSAGRHAPVMVVSRSVVPIEFSAGQEVGVDPHAWQDLGNAVLYVHSIATALGDADPAGASAYARNAAAYIARIKALDAEIRATIARIPPQQRRIVTSHDAFGYFARAYGLEVLAPVGVSGSAEPTAAGVAALIRQLRREQVPAVFIENISDPRLVQRIQQESGARFGGTLYSDALSLDKPAAGTYLGMMRTNLETLARAMLR
jgi:zinc/manganese transport system substrate-binding protein